MTIERLPLTALHPDPANARHHPQRNLDAIMSSLVRFGQQKPIVIDARNVVRAGNGTLAAAKAIGWTHLDAVRTDLASADATAFAIADNRTAELAAWDDEILGSLLAHPDIGDVGFNPKELDDILKRELPNPATDVPAEPTDVPETHQLIVDCEDEPQQKQLYDRLTSEGFPCRVLTL